MNRQEQIKSRQEEILRLQREETEEARKGILPFLKEHCVCSYEAIGRFIVYCDKENVNKLIALIEDKQNGGMYHFGCNISDACSIHYDDGVITIRIQFSGKTSELKRKIINECHQLGLKVNFDNEKDSLKSQINRFQSALQEILELEKEFQ